MVDGLSGMPGARDSVPRLGVSYSVGTGWGPENLISLTKYRISLLYLLRMSRAFPGRDGVTIHQMLS